MLVVVRMVVEQIRLDRQQVVEREAALTDQAGDRDVGLAGAFDRRGRIERANLPLQ